MLAGIDAQKFEAVQVHGLDLQWGGLDDDLVLIVVLEPVRVLPVSTVRGTAGGLHIGDPPWIGPEAAQEGGRVEGPCPDLKVIGLLQHTPLIRPEMLKGKDDGLERILLPHETPLIVYSFGLSF